MTERELVIEVSSSRELCAAIEELLCAQSLSSSVTETSRRIMSRLDAGLTERGVRHGISQVGHIGLNTDQMQPLFNATASLMRNVVPGMVGLKHDRGDIANMNLRDYQSDTGVYDTLDAAFDIARVRGLSATARVVFDDETGRGSLSVEHPLVEGYSPNFDLEQAMQVREAEGGELGLRANKFGGLSLIQHVVKDSLQLAGLRSESIRASDDKETGTRKVWFEFQKG